MARVYCGAGNDDGMVNFIRSKIEQGRDGAVCVVFGPAVGVGV